MTQPISNGSGDTQVAKRVESYQIVLPPGWVQHPVRRGVAERMFAHIRRHLEKTDNHQMMTELRTTVQCAMKDLKDNGGIDVFLPEKSTNNAAIPASLASMLVALGDRGIDPALRQIARGHTTEPIEVNVGTAYRWSTQAAGKDELSGLDTLNTHYLFPLPGDNPSSSVLFTFGVLKSEKLPDEYVEILTLIFEAMMQSLIWIYHEDN